MFLQGYCDQFELDMASEYALANRQVVAFLQAKEEDQQKSHWH